MIVLIAGASHTGKTVLAQKLLEKYKYPYLSIDHLKMGLIRSGNTKLTPTSDDLDLTAYLWEIVREMVKTAIENKQNLIVEGCYIPFDWEKDFEQEYLDNIRYYCLVMSEEYIRNRFADIKGYASVIENRIDDDCNLETVLEDNRQVLELAIAHKVNYILIDDEYKIDIALESDFEFDGGIPMNEQVREYIDKYSNEIIDMYDTLRKLIFDSASFEPQETMWAKIPSYYVGESFVRLIPFKDHINIEAKAVLKYADSLAGYKVTPKGMLQIFVKQEIPVDVLKRIFAETLV